MVSDLRRPLPFLIPSLGPLGEELGFEIENVKAVINDSGSQPASTTANARLACVGITRPTADIAESVSLGAGELGAEGVNFITQLIDG